VDHEGQDILPVFTAIPHFIHQFPDKEYPEPAYRPFGHISGCVRLRHRKGIKGNAPVHYFNNEPVALQGAARHLNLTRLFIICITEYVDERFFRGDLDFGDLLGIEPGLPRTGRDILHQVFEILKLRGSYRAR
jgi:hypothetical protein